MYGFREKYDDPFDFPEDIMTGKVGAEMAEAIDYSGPWHRFNTTTDRIRQLAELRSPLEAARLENVVSRLKQRVEKGSAFLFSLPTPNFCRVFLASAGEYRRLDIPLEKLKGLALALFEYQRKTMRRPEFRSKLCEFETDYREVLSTITAFVEKDQVSELVVVSDYLTEVLTFLPTILASDKVRARIRDRKFVYRACPALWSEPLHPLKTGPCVFIHNCGEDLELAQSEITMVRQATSDREFGAVDLYFDDLNFSERPLSEASILHLSTHCIPADSFADPMFVSTAAKPHKNSLWLESVQQEASRLKLNLAFLNGCNTGTTSNRNYFKNFSTNEQVGIASAILLNRRSAVVATRWNVTETAAYVFSYLFYKRVNTELDSAIAFIVALTDLYDLSKARALEIIATIEHEESRRQRVEVLTARPDFPFRDPYYLGLFQFCSLLVE
jgi:hypothetical protein